MYNKIFAMISNNPANLPTWEDVMNEARNYQYVVMYNDYYRGNGDGEFFRADNFAALRSEQPYWFSQEERPVYAVILTNDDVPAIIADRQRVIEQINNVEYTLSTIARPTLLADGRSTRRTNPAAWAAFDKAVADYNAQRDALQQCLTLLNKTLAALPYYSTTLLELTPSSQKN